MEKERSSRNNTTALLANGESYIGDWEDISRFDTASISVLSDVDVTLFFEQSSQRVSGEGNTRTVHSSFPPSGFKVKADVNEVHTARCMRSYGRIRIVNNSGSAQTVHETETLLGGSSILNAPGNLPVSLDADAVNVRAVEFNDEVVIGRRLGVTPFNKFAYRSGLTAAGGEQTIWTNTAANFTPLTTASTLTIAYNSSTDGLGTTGALALLFSYIDSNGLAAQASHTLGDTGSDVTSFSTLGVNRCVVTSSGSANTNNNDITITATTGSSAQAFIRAGDAVTQQAIYFVGSNSKAVGKLLFILCNKLSGGGSPRVLVKGYVYNRGVDTRFLVFRGVVDTSSEPILSINEPVGFRLNATDVLYFIADTDTNGTEIDIRFSVVEYEND